MTAPVGAPVSRRENLAYWYAEWVCSRQPSSMRHATVMAWAEVNDHVLLDGDLGYVWDHWRDYVETVPV